MFVFQCFEMTFKRYVLPSSVVVDIGFNLDSIVYILLLTFFNPIITWILFIFHIVPLLYALVITSLWICRCLNYKLRKSSDIFPTKKSILITGGVTGLGSEIVTQLKYREDIEKIIVVDIKKPEFNHNNNNESKNIEYIKYNFDDTSLSFLEKSIDLTQIDVLICNAGIRQLETIENLKEDEINKIINVNWISHLFLIKRFILSTKAKSKYQKSHIVVVGSVLGFVGPKKLGIYAATKNSLMALMDSLREELSSDVLLSTILPGQLNSKMFQDVNVNKFLAPVINIKKLSKKIIYIIDEGLNGTFAYPLYGRFLPIYRILPWFLQRFCRWFSGMDNV